MMLSTRSLFHRRLAGVIGLAALLAAGMSPAGVSSAAAQARGSIPTNCGARDILADTQKTEPEAYAKIKAAARNTLNGDGLLWKIEKPGLRPSYLFGTMHSNDPRLDRQVNRVRPLIAQSRAVAVEIGELVTPGAKDAAVRKIAEAGQATRGNALEALHPIQNRAIVEASLLQRGIPLERAQQLETWFLITALSSPLCEQQRRRLGLTSVDEKVGRSAISGGKKVIGLEKLEDQIVVLRQIGQPNPPIALIETARGAAQLANMRESMTQAYVGDRLGEIAALGRVREILSGETPSAASAAFTRSLLQNRNLIMRDNALPLLQRGGVFIAVGALHLPYDHGLVALFRQVGYRVTVMR
jgi:uncharacterized protein